DTDFAKVPVDVYAKAPGLRTTVVHTLAGDNTTTYDGQQAWVAAVDKPVPLMPLTGRDLEGAGVDAGLWFPAEVKQELRNGVDGQSTTELSSVQANVPIDAGRFTKPAPAVPKATSASR